MGLKAVAGANGIANLSGGVAKNLVLTNCTAVDNPGAHAIDASPALATNGFVQLAIQATMSTRPLNLGITGGGTYSFASVGTGLVIVYNSSGGSITGVLTIASAGFGYAVGDIVRVTGTPTQGNNDASMIVNTVGAGGAVLGLSVLYGGTGYTGVGGSAPGPDASSYPFTFELAGLLTSPALILLTPGTLLTQSNQWNFCNNTTGAFAVTVKLSGQSGGVSTNSPIGAGITIPQSTNNIGSTPAFTDGVNDVWALSAIPNLSGVSGSIGGGALGAGAVATGTVAVAGAAVGMAVSVTPNTYPGNGNVWSGYVSSAGTVTVVVTAVVAGTPVASTYNIRVIQ